MVDKKTDQENLAAQVKASIKKLERAEKEKKTILAQTVYLGTISFIFILPVIIGAYTGLWLDTKLSGFSTSWTITLIILGVFIGALNIYLFIKE